MTEKGRQFFKSKNRVTPSVTVGMTMDRRWLTVLAVKFVEKRKYHSANSTVG